MASVKAQSIANTGTIAERMRNASKATKYTIASFAVALVPLVGLGLSYVVDRFKNSHVAEKKKEVMTDVYRNQIAAQVGKDPSKVTKRDLEWARKNPKFNDIIRKIDDEKKNDNRNTAMSNAAAFAAGGFIDGAIGKAVVGVAGSVVGSKAASVFDKNELYVQDVVELIDEKRNAGQAVNAYDLVMLKIAQDRVFQMAFKSKYKKPFHQMSDAEKTAVLDSMPEALIGVEKQVYALNNNLISPQSLVMDTATPATSFAETIAASREQGRQREQMRPAVSRRETSYTDQYRAEQEAAAQRTSQVG